MKWGAPNLNLESLLQAAHGRSAKELKKVCSNRRAKAELLCAAVEYDDLELARSLVAMGAEPERHVLGGVCALGLACHFGKLSFAQLFLRDRDVRRIRLRHNSPLQDAAFYGHLELLRFLLKRGADPQEICKRPLGSLIRIRGDVLRALREAGGRLPSEIEGMLDRHVALGDEIVNGMG